MKTLPVAADLEGAGADTVVEFYDLVERGKAAPLFGEGQCAEDEDLGGGGRSSEKESGGSKWTVVRYDTTAMTMTIC